MAVTLLAAEAVDPVGEQALFGLVILVILGFTLSPMKSRLRAWIYWVAAPVAFAVPIGAATHSLLSGVVAGGVGLGLLAMIFAIRLLFSAGPARVRRAVLTALWLVPIVAVALWWMIHALRRGSYPTFIVEAMMVGGIAYFGAGRRWLRRASSAQRWRAWSEGRGTVVRANPLQAAGYTAALLSLTVGMLGFGALAMTGTLDYPQIGDFSRSDRRMLGEFALAGLISAPLVLWLAVTLLWTRGPGGELVLSPQGVSVRPDRTLAPLGPAGTLSWAEIAQSEISPIAAPRRRGRMDLVFAKAGNTFTIPLDLYPDPPETLVRLVRFYQRSPEHRCELGDDRAAERLRRGDFGVGADSA